MQIHHITRASDDPKPSSTMASSSNSSPNSSSSSRYETSAEDLLIFNLDLQDPDAPSSRAEERRTPATPSPNAAVSEAKTFLAAAINGTALPVPKKETHSRTYSRGPQQRENPNQGSQLLEKLGSGRCGTVFSIPGTDLVIKQSISTYARTKGDLRRGRVCFDIENDAAVHKVVEAGFRGAGFTAVHVPRLMDFVAAREFELKTLLLEARGVITGAQRMRLAEGSKRFILAERVPALDGRVRGMVAEVFCPGETVGDLIQPLLGIRCSELNEEMVRAGEQTVSLGDHKLCADQMADIGVDMKTVAVSLGQALAILHWVAKVDARGVKFVFAGNPTNIHYSVEGIGRYKPNSGLASGGSGAKRSLCPEQGMNRGGRRVHLWLLDCHEVSPISDELCFVEMAVHGFVASRCYPRPARDGALEQDHGLWAVFKEAYLAKCSEARGGVEDGRPESFLLKVEEHYLLCAGTAGLD